VHPKYGLLKGKIQSVTVNHPSDDIDHATVDLTFIEQMRQQLSAVSDRSVVSIVEEAYQEGQAQQESVLAAEFENYYTHCRTLVIVKRKF